MLLYHLKMPQSILYSFYLFLRTSRLSAILRFWLIVILALYDSMLLLYLSNVQICHMKSIVFLHPLLNLFVCCLSLRTCVERCTIFGGSFRLFALFPHLRKLQKYIRKLSIPQYWLYINPRYLRSSLLHIGHA